MRIVKGAVVASVVALVAPLAHAENAGWYMGAEMGAVFAKDADTTGLLAGDLEYDPGFALLGQVGGYLPYNFRLEAELGWRRNEMDELGGVGIDGDINVLSLMGNLYYDIPTGTAFTPYVGVGLGGAHMMFDTPAADDDDNVWAYQGIAGVDYRINDTLSLKADYRYFATQDFDAHGPGGRVESEYATHNVMIGFTYRFGAQPKKEVAEPARVAAPPPPPPPPPPAPTNYMVFFDWDKADLTPEAQAILRKAADSIRQGQITRVTLAGHADRSGSDRYNLRISERRAANVKAYLTELGVAPAAMTTSAKGESSPLVETPDGVREPQNRRVEIVLP